jgi:hypothetical protein
MSSKGGGRVADEGSEIPLYSFFCCFFLKETKYILLQLYIKEKTCLTENTLLPKDETLIPKDLEKWDER